MYTAIIHITLNNSNHLFAVLYQEQTKRIAHFQCVLGSIDMAATFAKVNTCQVD